MRARRRRGDGRVTAELHGANWRLFRLRGCTWQPPVAWLLLWSHESSCRCHLRALSCCLAARGARSVRAGAPSRLKEPITRQPVGRLTSGLKSNTATGMTCVRIEEWTDGDDVRRRVRVLRVASPKMTVTLNPCTYDRDRAPLRDTCACTELCTNCTVRLLYVPRRRDYSV